MQRRDSNAHNMYLEAQIVVTKMRQNPLHLQHIKH